MATGLKHADALLEAFYPEENAPMDRRELRAELAVGLLFAGAVVALWSLSPPTRVPWATGTALLLVYAGASRVRFHVGAMYAVPTQLILIPMLALLEPALVPVLVATGLVLATAPEVVRGRQPPSYLLAAVNDAWHAVGAAATLAVLGLPAGARGLTAVLVAASCAQALTDTAAIVVRQWLGRGISPRDQHGAVGAVQLVDALLLGPGILAALAAQDGGITWALVVPVLGLCALMAHDRRQLVVDAQARLAELDTERGRRELALRRVGEAFATTLEIAAVTQLAIATAVDTTTARGGWLRCGPEPPAQTGLSDDDAALVRAAEAGGDDGQALSVAAAGTTCAVACRLPGLAGAWLGVVLDEPVGDEAVIALERLAAQTAVSLQKARLHARLHEQATTDELTGLPNRRRLFECLQDRFADGSPVSVVLLDLDDFKAVNDTHGHGAGDAVLARAGRILGDLSGPAVEAARLGGEEFAVLADPAVAPELAEELRRAIAAAPVRVGEIDVRVTASLGVARRDASMRTPSDLLAAADVALYEAKSQGKDRVVLGLSRHGEPVRVG